MQQPVAVIPINEAIIQKNDRIVEGNVVYIDETGLVRMQSK